ncbi:MAG: DUF502 domain-containing protein [Gammaproteobacteria bacterium]|nr:DUF502 domain-containing protein [Gammaproteobacteria bacterium]
MAGQNRKTLHVRGYLLAGILTVVPLWVTWIVFEFIFSQLSKFGTPWVRAIAKSFHNIAPVVEQWLLAPWFQNLLAVLLTLVALYLLGWLVSRVVGRRLIGAFELIVSRVPLARTVYGSVKKLITTLQGSLDDVQRVVLIAFPSPEMRTVGLVTQTMTDSETGAKLAAVYVPTTPNPTSGYLEIIPLEDLTPTDWSIDEAMTFIISGGAVAPDTVSFGKIVTPKQS